MNERVKVVKVVKVAKVVKVKECEFFKFLKTFLVPSFFLTFRHFFSEGTCSVNIWFCSVSAEYVITRQTEQVRRNILFFSEGTCSANIRFCTPEH